MKQQRPQKLSQEQIVGRKRCMVCGLKSVHMHYGADSCKACSIFFRRTLVYGSVYECKRLKEIEEEEDSDSAAELCPIVVGDDNTCYGCRLDRCLLVGMCAGAIRYPPDFDFARVMLILTESLDRIIKRQKLAQRKCFIASLSPSVASSEQSVSPIPEQITHSLQKQFIKWQILCKLPLSVLYRSVEKEAQKLSNLLVN